MDTGNDRIGSFKGPARGGGDLPQPAAGPARRQAEGGKALTVAPTETFSMEEVSRFFDRTVEPQGNSLVGEMVDENGPLAGREGARGRRRPGDLALQFSDDDRSLLFAPSDAPDELPQQPTELDRLLRQQELRERRRFGA